MASIRKRGESYLIVVSMGYDYNGNRRKAQQKEAPLLCAAAAVPPALIDSCFPASGHHIASRYRICPFLLL